MDADDPAPPPRATSAVADPPEELLRPGRLVGATALLILGILGVTVVLGAFLRAPLQRISAGFVDALGGPGIAIGYLIPDAFTVPVPNDAFGWFGLEGGMPFWIVALWGTLGSLTGGSLGYVIGRKLGSTRRAANMLATKGRRLEQLLQRYGVWVVAVAAITPLPYSLSAWAAGAVRMRFSVFFAASLVRVVRVTGALALIKLGLLTVTS